MKTIISFFNSFRIQFWKNLDLGFSPKSESFNLIPFDKMNGDKKHVNVFILISMLLLLSLAGRTALQAQDGTFSSTTDIRSRLCFGFKLGINYANVFDERGEDFVADPKFGSVLGAFVSIPIGPYFGVQPELLYSQKGFRSTGAILGQRYELTRTTNYIDIPLLFAFKPGEFISLVIGPQYSYLIKQVDEVKTPGGSTQQVIQFDNTDVHKNIFGAIGGVDFTMKHFVLGARIGADFLKNAGSGNSSEPRYKNFWFQATIGYRFYRP
jgi:hypothetical protein